MQTIGPLSKNNFYLQIHKKIYAKKVFDPIFLIQKKTTTNFL